MEIIKENHSRSPHRFGGDDPGVFTLVSLEPTLDVESSLAIVKATHGFEIAKLEQLLALRRQGRAEE